MALRPRQTGSSIKIFILVGGDRGRGASRRPDRRHVALRAAQSRRSEGAVRHHVGRQQAAGDVAGDDVVVDQLRVRPPVADRRPEPSRRHDLSDGHSATSPATRPSTAPARSSRSPATRPVPTRWPRSTWPPACRRSRTTGCITIRTTSSASTAPTDLGLPARDRPVCRCSTPQAADTTVNILKGVLTRGTARSVGGLDGGARPGRRQDRHAGQQHQLLVRRLHAAADDRGVGRRSEGLHPHGEHPRVHGGRGAARCRAARSRPAIWKAFMEPAHFVLPALDWPAPAATRSSSRRGCTCPATNAWLDPAVAVVGPPTRRSPALIQRSRHPLRCTRPSIPAPRSRRRSSIRRPRCPRWRAACSCTTAPEVSRDPRRRPPPRRRRRRPRPRPNRPRLQEDRCPPSTSSSPCRSSMPPSIRSPTGGSGSPNGRWRSPRPPRSPGSRRSGRRRCARARHRRPSGSTSWRRPVRRERRRRRGSSSS